MKSKGICKSKQYDMKTENWWREHQLGAQQKSDHTNRATEFLRSDL